MNWEKWLEEIESLTRRGLHEDVRLCLSEKSPKSVPSEFRARLGEIAFRVNEYLYALKVLRGSAITEKEKVIYATSLFSIGAVNEASQLLDKLNPEINPDVYFYRALALFTQWEYGRSIPVLKNYLATFTEKNYRYIVGQVNLIAALVINGSFEEAQELIKEVEQTCIEGKHQLLYGNILELQGQLNIAQRKMDQAIEVLHRSIEVLKEQKGLYSFFAEKWLAIAQALKTPENASKIFSLIREKASELKHWETLRDCDLFQAAIEKNMDLARKVIFGTPWTGYRKRAQEILGSEIPEVLFHYRGNYDWKIMSVSSQNSMDITEKIFGTKGLAKQKTLFAAFLVLTSDFYKPFNLGSLFQEIYPNQYFDANNSPERIIRTLARLKKWFKEQEIPLSVGLNKGEFRLIPLSSVQISLSRGQKITPGGQTLLFARNEFEGKTFTALEAAKVLNVSKSKALTVLKEALASGEIQSIGNGRSKMYRFKAAS